MKISSQHLKKIVEDALYMRKVCIHEIRYMGEEKLRHLFEKLDDKNEEDEDYKKKNT